MVGINVIPYKKALHVATYHETDGNGGDDNPGGSHYGMRLEDYLENTTTGETWESKWDIEPIARSSISTLSIKQAGGPSIMTFYENMQVTINKSSLSNIYRFGVGGSAYFSDKVAVGSTTIPSGFRFGVAGSGFFSDKISIGTTTSQNILNLHRQGVTPVYAYFTNGHTETTGNGQGFRIGMSAKGHAELRSHHPGGAIKFFTTDASDNFSEKMRITGNDQVGIGTEGLDLSNYSDFKLLVDGKIICEKVRVKMSGDWPDYVSKKNLMPFKYKLKYFEDNKHMPGFPTAGDVKKNGFDVGDISVLLLKNDEEFLLYMAEMKEEMAVMKTEIEDLKNVNEENKLLKAINEKLEKENREFKKGTKKNNK